MYKRMEKYTQFQDNTSGINPFLRIAPESGKSFFTANNTLRTGLVGAFLILIRVPFVFLLLCNWQLIDILPLPVFYSVFFELFHLYIERTLFRH